MLRRAPRRTCRRTGRRSRSANRSSRRARGGSGRPGRHPRAGRRSRRSGRAPGGRTCAPAAVPPRCRGRRRGPPPGRTGSRRPGSRPSWSSASWRSRPAPHGRLVHHVVVVERREVGQLHHHGSGHDHRRRRVAELRAERHQQRPEPLAARLDEVRAASVTHRVGAGHTGPQLGLPPRRAPRAPTPRRAGSTKSIPIEVSAAFTARQPPRTTRCHTPKSTQPPPTEPPNLSTGHFVGRTTHADRLTSARSRWAGRGRTTACGYTRVRRAHDRTLPRAPGSPQGARPARPASTHPSVVTLRNPPRRRRWPAPTPPDPRHPPWATLRSWPVPARGRADLRRVAAIVRRPRQARSRPRRPVTERREARPSRQGALLQGNSP